MKNILFLVSVIFLIFMVEAKPVFSQVMTGKVTVQTEHLQSRDQQELSGLAQQLTSYINGTSWSDDGRDIIVNYTIQITIKTVSTRGTEKIYPSEFLISSPSGENFYDRTWEFTYVPGEAFESFRTSFDPLLDMVDFYVYMVIGGEMDTYELFAGTPFYDKARDIANQGQLSNYSRGWTDRLEEVLLITDGDHVPLREAKFYYYEGLYFVEREPNPQYARQLAEGVVARLAAVSSRRPNSRALKRFLDAHYQEMCKLFQFDPDRSNINKMIDIDGRHRASYENCQPGS